MQCNGQYGIADMQELMLAAGGAGGATNHMFALGQPQHVDGDGRPPSHHHHHPHHHAFHQSLQPQQAAEMLDIYHRQVGLQDHHSGLHLSQPELHGSHILFGLHNLQPKEFSLHQLAHQMGLGSDSSEVPLAPCSTTLSHMQEFMKQGAASRELAPQIAEDFGDVGAEEADRLASLGGSRWPRHETLMLLRIRSDMDSLFRDSGVKGPLWEEVSRKLAEAGYHRSAKKCKEKFENVHKYYKKTKDDRQDRKTYRFCTELEAIYAASQEQELQEVSEGATVMAMDEQMGVSPSVLAAATSGNPGTLGVLEGGSSLQMMQPGAETSTGRKSASSTSCGNEQEKTDTAGTEQEQAVCQRKRKRSSTWRSMQAFFADLAKQLMERQDALHKKFLEAVEQREEERARREEAYKRQEMARLNREQELRAHEQALAAARDAALVDFLHKVTGETLKLPEMPSSTLGKVFTEPMEVAGDGGLLATPYGEDATGPRDAASMDAINRRWPKAEVLALIRVRTSLEPRFQEAGPKAQLWEEVAASMSCLGFTRSAKRCKEKWENINKYYRKTKDNVGRKLRLDRGIASKTCPYFQQLEALYERGILASPNSSSGVNNKSLSKLDGSQNSEDLLESTTSKDDSQLEGNGNDGGGAHVTLGADMQLTENGQDRLMPWPGCSDTPTQLTSVASRHEGGVQADVLEAKTESSLSDSGLINVNRYPPPHFCNAIQEQEQQIGHASHVTNFASEMMDIEEHHQRLPGQLYEHPEVMVQQHDHVAPTRVNNQQAVIDKEDMQLRMQQQEGMSGLNQEQSHGDSTTLMALVHKLAAGGDGGHGHSSEFGLSSPTSTNE